MNGNLLYFTLMYCFKKFDWKNTIQGLDENKFMNLAFGIQGSYRDNHYHSQIHAADVVQTVCYYLESCDVKNLCQLNDYEIFMTILSAAAHDMDHPGTNNAF